MIKKTSQFTREQLLYFKKEIEEAGGTDELMIKKEALEYVEGMTMIRTYKNIEGYKEKHLTGVYESLRPIYTTEVPYVFWNRLYVQLNRI